MRSGNSSGLSHQPLPHQKQTNLKTSEILTPSELERLQRKREEMNAVLAKAYPGVTILD